MNTKVNITETGMKLIQDLLELRKAFHAIGQHEHEMPTEAYNGMVNGFHTVFRGLESEIVEEIFNANSWEQYRTLHPLLPQSGLASKVDGERKAETTERTKGH